MVMPNNSSEYQRPHNAAPNYQTSCTKDEAVGMLMGLIHGPIQLTPLDHEPSDEELELEKSIYYSVMEDLDGERDSAEINHVEAKFDNLPADIIAEKLAALEECDTKIGNANAYLNDINDELNKGETSALRIHTGASTGLYQHITLTSLDEWARNRYDIPILGDRKSKTVTASQQTQTILQDKSIRWVDVTIKLYAGYKIAYFAANIGTKGKVMHFQEIELMGKRKNEPNIVGHILIGLSTGEKYPTLKSPQNKNSAAMSKLRKALKQLTGISGDPFYTINEGDGWKTRFKLIDDRKNADVRAKERAQHVPFDDLRDFDKDNDETDEWLNEND